LKLLITGGAGFIGSHFTKFIVNQNEVPITEVIVLDSLTYAGNLANLESIKQKIEFIHGDIRNVSLVNKVTQQVDTIINFAAESHVDRSIKAPHIFLDTNVLGLHNLLHFARINSITNFLQVSTDEVYGSINEGKFTETDLLNPTSPYSASKASGDLLALSYFKNYGLNIKITRSSNNYGPNQFPEKIIPLFITNLMKNMKLPIYGDGTNIRDWIYVDDNCRGIFTVLNKGKSGSIYNIGGGYEITNLNLALQILKEMGHSKNKIEFVTDRKAHDFRYSIDCSKIENELGFRISKDFSEGLKETIQWYLNHAIL